MNEKQRARLNELMSFILRHEPYKFDVLTDEDGFVKINELINSETINLTPPNFCRNF
ncbi:MAG: hypothetical protein DRN29_10925 [Thermoplasmata archaeon]|nr:MAG: hypothetical protein DRN29_10925 [Thermoplasmata archaeon]